MTGRLMAATIAALVVSGTALADECMIDALAPTMPDPSTASAEDRSETVASIKEYQAALAPYRECLTAIADNKKLTKEERAAASDAFNASVDDETKMVEDWVAFDESYKAAND